MKVSYKKFQELIPDLKWGIDELAEKLSLSGHEAEVVDKDFLNITLTANRQDCRDIKYLAFDLAGVYGLKTVSDLIEFGHGEPIEVTSERINRLLGSKITQDDLTNLERLGFKVSPGTVTPPEFRDILNLADVSEEVMRQVGYGELNIQPLTEEKAPSSEAYQHLLAVQVALVSTGLVETTTSSFTRQGAVDIKDPFSRNEPFLRPNLQEGLLKTLSKNPFLKRSAFFEIGNVITPSEQTKLGVIIAGYKDKEVETWRAKISRSLGCDVKFTAVEPSISNELDVKQSRLSYFEISVDQLKPITAKRPTRFDLPLPKFQSISKFPPLVRDITIDELDSNSVDDIKKLDGLLLVEKVDEYGGRVTYRVVLQKTESSYTESDIQAIDTQLKKFSD
ncbi:MAG: hypothetical protein Q8Q05_03825 [bacterium]|nr:hypothetical protein [bacterium]